MTHVTLDDFEARYQANEDPWSYEASPYERAKYAATLGACGPGPFGEALELGSSIGVFSVLLAGRCEHLTTIDGAATAVAAARRRLAGRREVEVILGSIPDAIPERSYDLVIASEVLYYLQPRTLMATLKRLHRVCAPSARLVAVHWRPPGEERPFTAEQVHRALRAEPWLSPRGSAGTVDYLLDVFGAR